MDFYPAELQLLNYNSKNEGFLKLVCAETLKISIATEKLHWEIY